MPPVPPGMTTDSVAPGTSGADGTNSSSLGETSDHAPGTLGLSVGIGLFVAIGELNETVMVVAEGTALVLGVGVVAITSKGSLRVWAGGTAAGWLLWATQTTAVAPPPTTRRAAVTATTTGQRRAGVFRWAGWRCIASKS